MDGIPAGWALHLKAGRLLGRLFVYDTPQIGHISHRDPTILADNARADQSAPVS